MAELLVAGRAARRVVERDDHRAELAIVLLDPCDREIDQLAGDALPERTNSAAAVASRSETCMAREHKRPAGPAGGRGRV